MQSTTKQKRILKIISEKWSLTTSPFLLMQKDGGLEWKSATFLRENSEPWVPRNTTEIYNWVSAFREKSAVLSRWKILLTKTNSGLVKINGEKTSADYRICNNDFLSHVVHRHELPVTGEPIRIVHQSFEVFWLVEVEDTGIITHREIHRNPYI